MDSKRLNVSQICSVSVYIKLENTRYEYRKESKFLFWKTQEGFYSTLPLSGDICYSKEELEADKELYCKDDKVYFKPHVDIRMSNGSLHTKYFNEPIDVYNFLSSEDMRKASWIELVKKA